MYVRKGDFLFYASCADVGAIHAPAAPEAKDSNISEHASKTSKRIDENVSDSGIAAHYGKLMHFVDGAINGSDNDWINN